MNKKLKVSQSFWNIDKLMKEKQILKDINQGKILTCNSGKVSANVIFPI